MKKESTVKDHRGLLLSLVVLGLAAALIILPNQFRSEAGSQQKSGEGLFERTHSHEEGLENYDIRSEKNEEAAAALLKYRQVLSKDAAVIADTRENFVRGENALRQTVPTLKVEYNDDIRIPEVIGPDVKQGRNFLTSPSSGKRSEILRNFVKQNNNLIGVDNSQADQLKVLADYTNPDGNLSFAHLEQRINDVPVFRGEVKAGFTRSGEMIRVINNLAPGLDYSAVSTDFGSPLDAVRAGAGHINYTLKTEDVTRNDAVSTDLKTVFGTGDWATTAEKMYFPTEPGVAVPAWRVLIWQPVNAYYIIVDARSGTMLWRKNITEDQTQSATYQVYTNPNAMINGADSPAPLSPGPIDPTLGTQGAIIPRNNVTRIGNEGAYNFVNNGWITDGANVTDGNFNEAGIDRVAPNGVDAPQPGDGPCPGAGCRVFTSTWNPPPGNPTPGDDPLTPQAQRGAVIQMFYIMNLFQSEMYRLGFTEQALNFQQDNFGRGGLGNDRVSSEGQDSSGTNNANFSTPADGGRGRMQMYIWTGPTPDYDGTADADIIIHEVTHGLSNRLHGNSAGLSTNMARGMGEGWSDFYAHAMLSEPSDPSNGIYSLGGYATYLAAAGFTGNYYYGIRRYPKAPIAFTGGANNKPHNAYIFSDINAGCATRFTNANFAFARGPFGAAQCDAVHNAGEVWSSALWEVREKFIARLGWSVGNRKALQLVTDGMKLAPLAPTFLTERDAILAAAQASAAAPEAGVDVADVWSGFALRGMGFSASIQSASPATVTNGFDLPNVVMAPTGFAVSDAPGDGDGFPEPGENVLITVPIVNNTGSTVNNVQVNINGGPNVSYGNIADGQTVTNQIAYTIPADATCGGFFNININITSAVGTRQETEQIRLGAPIGGPPTTFTSNTLVNIPAGQPTTTVGPADPYPSTINVSGLTGNKVIKLELTGLNHTWVADVDILLVSPAGQKMIVFSDAYNSSNRTNTVVTTLTLSDDAAATAPSTGVPPPSGNFKPTNHGANDPFVAPAPAAPYENPAPAGSATFASVYGMDGAAMNGAWNLYVVDDTSTDPGTMAGWKLTFESDDYLCSISPSSGRARADFDGDGRTDLSVFRPGEGNWYINGSTAGFSVRKWGLSGDVLVPGDFDGDGKADTAIFRATADSSQPDFYILNSNGFTVTGASWGLPGDIPVVGDYNGDGKTDIAVFRPSNNTWYILNSGGVATITQFGQSGDIPIVADLDGDGKTDLTVKRGNNWIAQLSGGGTVNKEFGLTGDIPTPADYDGDGKDDIAVFRPSNGTWYLLLSSGSGNTTFIPFGQSGDVPVPGDYDGDGKDDQAIYRNGQWWIRGSTSGVSVSNFGVSTDTPIPNRYLP